MNLCKRGGFTVIEVMVALAIFASAAIVLGMAYVNVMTGYERLRVVGRVDEEVKFARAAVLNEPDATKASEGGKFESVDGRQVSWTAQIEPVLVPDLHQVTFQCEVTAPDAKAPERVEEVWLVLRPTWSSGGSAGGATGQAAGATQEKLRLDVRKRIDELNAQRRP